MRKSVCAAVAAAAVAAVGLPASASAQPPITPPEGSTCTFARGLTTCIAQIGVGSVLVVRFDDPSCPSGMAERRTTTSSITTTTTVFRGVHQLGEPRTETVTNSSTTVSCV